MATFVYHYIDESGRTRLYWQKAENSAACYELLADCGIYPLHMIGVRKPVVFVERGLNTRQLAMVLRQLSMALTGGVPLLDALHYIRQEQASERVRAFLARIENGILAGQLFSETLQREKGVAPLLSQWIAIGERQGKLGQVLEEVYAHLEQQERLRKRIQQELLYPLIVLVALLVLGAVLSFVVMPVLARQFMGFSAEVPLFMRFFLLVHDICVEYGVLLLLAGVILLALMVLFRKNRREHVGNRSVGKRWALRMPLVRDYFVLKIYVPFARLFSQLLQSGVPVSDALEELSRYFSRSLFAEDIADMVGAMAQGDKLSRVIAEAEFVPEMARQMLLSGERYGRLPQALADSADYYETILVEKLALWIRFVEPLAVVLLGLLILFMALGLFVPVLESYQTLLAQ